MHSRFYSAISGFGSAFECVVASGLADFIPRLDNPKNDIWHISIDGKISANIAIHSEYLEHNTAHLRRFIFDDNLRGTGMGIALMAEAIEFCKAQAVYACALWTFKGLSAARTLCKSHGFKLTDEYQENQWGKEVTEQKFVKCFT